MKAVHIGFPKTATTFLQTAVFPKLGTERFVYVGKDASARLFGALIDDDDTLFDAAALRVRLDESVGDAERALFSYEGLTGHHYRSGFVNRAQIARRLKAAGFDRVLITIRNQFDVLESAYKEYVKNGGVLRLRDYIAFDRAGPKYLHPRYFDYHLIHALYAATFGTENVLVLQHEQLSQASFTKSLADFLGSPPITTEATRRTNESLSYEKTLCLRVCNHVTSNSYRPSSLLSRRFSTALVYRCLRSVPFGNSRRSLIDADTRTAIAAFYAESNRKLATAIGTPLASVYPL